MHGQPTRHNWGKPRDQRSQLEHIDKALLVTLARLSVANLESNATSGTPMERYKVLSIQAATLRRRWSGGSVPDEPAFDGPTQPAVIIAGHMGVPNSMKPWDHFRTFPRTRPCRKGNHTRRNCRNANRSSPPCGCRSSGSVSKYPVHFAEDGNPTGRSPRVRPFTTLHHSGV